MVATRFPSFYIRPRENSHYVTNGIATTVFKKNSLYCYSQGNLLCEKSFRLAWLNSTQALKQMQQAAISTLFGKVLTWQKEIGINPLQWNDWIQGLRGAFEVQLTESQWQNLLEGRKQQPNETGFAYVHRLP